MPIDIPSLFSDIIESPEQKRTRLLTEGTLLGRELTSGLRGLAATQAPLVSALAMQMPQRREDIRRGVGGMLGLDVRTQGEKVQDILKRSDTKSPKGLRDLSKALSQVAPAQALALNRAADERELLDLQLVEAREAKTKARLQSDANIRYRNFAAKIIGENTKYQNYAPSVRRGDMPMEQVTSILEEINAKPDKDAYTGLLVQDGGVTTSVWFDGKNYYKPDMTPFYPSENATITKLPTVAGTPDDFMTTPKMQQTAFERYQQTQNFVNSVNDAIQFYTDNPNANTAVAQLSGVVGDIGQNVQALKDMAYPDGRSFVENPDTFFNENNLRGKLTELGVSNAEAQSVMLFVALQYAAATGLGEGRSLTDRDIERAFDAVGVGNQDVDQIIATLRRSKANILRSYNTFQDALQPGMRNPVRDVDFTDLSQAEEELF